ncbi:hypothetical protein Btru_063587 [Bulinus truncatus]|nr:hypothetical protein Btru_063587 [Bulinus truncatus]
MSGKMNGRLFLIQWTLLLSFTDAKEKISNHKADKLCALGLKANLKDLKLKFCQVRRALRETRHQLTNSDKLYKDQLTKLTSHLDVCQRAVISFKCHSSTTCPCVTDAALGGDGLKSCTLGSNCASNECCVYDKVEKRGVCKPMTRVGARCYTKQPYAWSRPEAVIVDFDTCPCLTGHFCSRVSVVDPVYGQMGICSFGK